MVPPRNIALKIGYERLRRGELAVALGATVVAVITFPHLVVVAKHAYAIHDVCQPILQVVRRARNGCGYLPEDEFSEGVLCVDDSRPSQPSSLHVGYDDNICECCQ